MHLGQDRRGDARRAVRFRAEDLRNDEEAAVPSQRGFGMVHKHTSLSACMAFPSSRAPLLLRNQAGARSRLQINNIYLFPPRNAEHRLGRRAPFSLFFDYNSRAISQPYPQCAIYLPPATAAPSPRHTGGGFWRLPLRRTQPNSGCGHGWIAQWHGSVFIGVFGVYRYFFCRSRSGRASCIGSFSQIYNWS